MKTRDDFFEKGFVAEELRKLWDRHREPHGMDMEGFTESLNAIFQAHLASGVRVYGRRQGTEGYGFAFSPNKGPSDTETALLIGIRKLEGKE